MTTEETRKRLESLRKKSAKGRALLEQADTRRLVTGNEFKALLDEAFDAPEKDRGNKIIEAMIMLYEAGAYNGACIERSARKTKETTNARKTGGTGK